MLTSTHAIQKLRISVLGMYVHHVIHPTLMYMQRLHITSAHFPFKTHEFNELYNETGSLWLQ